ncbi:MAG: FkbM family methyltransferase, partial [Alphaproteobacteria bacterium]
LSRQRWLPYKTRRSVIKKLHPAMLQDYPFEADLLGLRFRGNIVNYIDRLVYFCGAHEKYMLFMLRDYVRKLRVSGEHDLVFFDVGANAGNHSLYLSTLVDAVHAFEPFERVRKQLKANIALNGISNITVHPFGLSNEEATLPFYAAPEANLGAASFFADHKEDNYYLGDMQLKRGDDLGLGRVDILKADVEGFEKFVLEGLNATITMHRPLMVIELSPKTRETLGGEQDFMAMFPENYVFCYFVTGSNNSGSYRLAPYDYHLTPKIQDVIACPQERVKTILP